MDNLNRWFDENWTLISRIDNVVAILGGLITIFVFLFREPSSIFDNKFKFEIWEKVKISEQKEFVGFDAKFTFNGKPVRNLWKYIVVMSNKGKNSIVGRGTKSDLINDDFIIDITGINDTSIQLIHIDIEENQADVTVRQIGNRNIGMSFYQWMPNETVKLIIYLDAKDSSDPFISLNRRQVSGWIIQAADYPDILKNDYRSIQNFSVLIEKAASTFLLKAAASLGLLIPAFLYFAMTLESVKNIYNTILNVFWEIKHRRRFNKKLEDLELSHEERLKIKKRPWSLSKDKWDEIGIPAPQVTFGGIGSATLFLLFSLFLLLGVGYTILAMSYILI